MAEVEIDVAGIMAMAREADKQARLAYAEEVLQPAADAKCPVLTGTMVGTGHIEDEGDDVCLTYGPLAYVCKQYFDDTMNHPHGGESHWSERAAEETADQLAQCEADAFEEAFG